MATIDIECFQDEYYKILNRVAGKGIRRSPRGMPTRDLGHTTIVVHNIGNPVLPLHTGRRLGKTIAALEALQIIGEVSKPDLMLKAAPQFANYMERDSLSGQPLAFHGAYGLRVRGQVDAALDKLKRDPDTRQAVITIWDPTKDNWKNPTPRDIPCTVALGLSIVDNELQLQTLMRSNDCWLGLPNDVFVFTQLQWTLAHILGISPGVYIHTTWSLHLYEHDLEKIDRVGVATKHEYQPPGLVCSTHAVAKQVANMLLAGDSGLFKEDTSEEEASDWLSWYRDAIASVVG